MGRETENELSIKTGEFEGSQVLFYFQLLLVIYRSFLFLRMAKPYVIYSPLWASLPYLCVVLTWMSQINMPWN